MSHQMKYDPLKQEKPNNPVPLPDDPIEEEPRVERETRDNPRKGFFESIIQKRTGR